MIEFKEEQRFNQAWVWVIAIVPVIMVIAEFSIIFTQKDKVETSDLITMAIVLLVLLLTLFWLKKMRLVTSININEICFHYKALMRKPKVIDWNDIISTEVVKYDPLMEYGGWGIKYSFKRGWCYNVAGDYGLRIKLKNGKSILLGTQQPDELKRFLTDNNLK